jgi:phospholipid/cholesterol/gamma-HCH transport system substrate-binding protein
MKIKTKTARLGIFIFISIVLLFSLVFFFSANKLFEKSDKYYVLYQGLSVGGLEVGSPVNYLGISIGSISNISIDPKDINAVIVELAIKPGTPIKKDAYADIISMGITGLKAIEIRGGSNQAESLSPGEYLKAGSSVTEEITGRASVIAEKAEKVINNLQLFTDPGNMDKFSNAAQNINSLAEQLNKTVYLIDTLLKENREAINETLSSAKLASGNFSESSQTFKEAIATINSIIQSDTIQQIVDNAHDISQHLKEADLDQFIENLTRVTEQTRKFLYTLNENLENNSQELAESVRLLRITLSNLEEVTNKINNNPSILIRGSKDVNIPDKRLKNK